MGILRSVCPTCGEIFAGVAAFDAHRTGSFKQRTRRCMSRREMQTHGMTRNEKGWWMMPLVTNVAPWFVEMTPSSTKPPDRPL
ncbi:MAG TPA: hypothetical protein VFA10_00450 [Ktedonobacteraceae bacterium]|nr:hypothetical protein [Ktedonobacteraceae bacterium]